jgi:5-methylcytosine-specific restriction endonuclease McrA
MSRYYRRKKRQSKRRDPNKLTAETIRKSIEAMRAEILVLQKERVDLAPQVLQHRQIRDRINDEIRQIWEQRCAIRNHPNARKSALHAFFSNNPYTDHAVQQVRSLESAIAAKRATLPRDLEPDLRLLVSQIAKIESTIVTYEYALAPHVKRKEEVQRKKELQRQRIAELRAAAASASGTTRRLGSKVRDRIARQEQCPYCGGPLGLTPHADHIYPVSKGGRSVERNMVFACSPCNAGKGDLTLTAFIKAFHLDREAIETRLAALGKEF